MTVISKGGIVPIGGTTADNDLYVGQKHEISVDDDTHGIRVHDGLTQGGFAINPIGKHWEIIQSVDVASNQTNIVFSGLNGNVDEEYKIVAKIESTSSNYTIIFNGDTSVNYAYQYIATNGGTGTDVGRSNSSSNIYLGTGASTHLISDITIYAKTGYVRPVVATTSDTFNYTGTYGGQWSNTSSNITSITIQGPMHTGTHIELWSKR